VEEEAGRFEKRPQDDVKRLFAPVDAVLSVALHLSRVLQGCSKSRGQERRSFRAKVQGQDFKSGSWLNLLARSTCKLYKRGCIKVGAIEVDEASRV
jgi:hypothetical protein